MRSDTAVTPLYAALGIGLIIASIPLGLMIAPLVVGVVLLAQAMRRADRAINEPFRGSSA
jgi:hypothetical protein